MLCMICMHFLALIGPHAFIQMIYMLHDLIHMPIVPMHIIHVCTRAMHALRDSSHARVLKTIPLSLDQTKAQVG